MSIQALSLRFIGADGWPQDGMDVARECVRCRRSKPSRFSRYCYLCRLDREQGRSYFSVPTRYRRQGYAPPALRAAEPLSPPPLPPGAGEHPPRGFDNAHDNGCDACSDFDLRRAGLRTRQEVP